MALTLFAVVSAASGSAEAAAKDQEARLAAARRVMMIVTPKESWSKMLDEMGGNMVQAARAGGQPIPLDFLPKMRLVMEDVVPYDELIEWSAQLYAKRFTLKELEALERFYKTPVGAKLARELPGLMGEVGSKLGAMMPERMPAAMRKHGLVP